MPIPRLYNSLPRVPLRKNTLLSEHDAKCLWWYHLSDIPFSELYMMFQPEENTKGIMPTPLKKKSDALLGSMAAEDYLQDIRDAIVRHFAPIGEDGDESFIDEKGALRPEVVQKILSRAAKSAAEGEMTKDNESFKMMLGAALKQIDVKSESDVPLRILAERCSECRHKSWVDKISEFIGENWNKVWLSLNAGKDWVELNNKQ